MIWHRPPRTAGDVRERREALLLEVGPEPPVQPQVCTSPPMRYRPSIVPASTPCSAALRRTLSTGSAGSKLTLANAAGSPSAVSGSPRISRKP